VAHCAQKHACVFIYDPQDAIPVNILDSLAKFCIWTAGTIDAFSAALRNCSKKAGQANFSDFGAVS
jgi:hypothetical protein